MHPLAWKLLYATPTSARVLLVALQGWLIFRATQLGMSLRLASSLQAMFVGFVILWLPFLGWFRLRWRLETWSDQERAHKLGGAKMRRGGGER
jgi:hypothetical protein